MNNIPADNIPAEVQVAIADISNHLDREKSVKEQLEKAMELAIDYWLFTNEEDRFKSAVGAVLIGISKEEQDVIADELKIARAINTAIGGVPVDFASLAEQVKPEKFYGLSGMWHETKKRKEKKT